MFKIYLVIIFIIFPVAGFSQINENGKFENGSFECIGNNEQPLNWYILGPLRFYSFFQDSINPFAGKFSGRIKPLIDCSKKSSIVCYQRAIIPNIKNRTVINFRLKMNSGSHKNIQYFIRPMSAAYDVNFEKYIDTTIVKIIGDTLKNKWFTYSVEMRYDKKVNSNAFFNIGFIAQDSIDFNIDGVEIFKDDKRFEEYPCEFEKRNFPNESDMSWVENTSIPILNASDNINLKDLSKLKIHIGNSSVIALGESTHGTKEFYTLRTRIIKYLIDSLNFEVVAFESGFENYHLANRLLETSTIPTRKIVDSLFTTNIYKTNEVVKLIDLIRKDNLNKKEGKIVISGFDEQGYYFQGAFLSQDFKGKDSTMTKLINEINVRIRNTRFKQKDTIYKLSILLYDRFKEIKQKLFISSKELDSFLIDKKLRSFCNGLYLKYLFEQVQIQNNNGFALANTFRDSLMAENIIWLKQYYKGKKIIILCHNAHVQKNKEGSFEQTTQGYFLQKKLPKGDYKSFAFLTAEGELTGYKKYPPEIIQVFKPYKSCYEYYFSKMKDSIFFLPLLQNKETSKHKKIVSGLKMREAGYGISDGYDPFKEVDLLNGFDGVFFIRKTSPTNSFLNKIKL